MTMDQVLSGCRRVEARAACCGWTVKQIECTPSRPWWSAEFTNGKRFEADKIETILEQMPKR